MRAQPNFNKVMLLAVAGPTVTAGAEFKFYDVTASVSESCKWLEINQRPAADSDS